MAELEHSPHTKTNPPDHKILRPGGYTDWCQTIPSLASIRIRFLSRLLLKANYKSSGNRFGYRERHHRALPFHALYR
jgi:hypothetical protein